MWNDYYVINISLIFLQIYGSIILEEDFNLFIHYYAVVFMHTYYYMYVCAYILFFSFSFFNFIFE